MFKVGIVGGTGYTGVELLRLLARHPDIEIKVITSRSEAGRPVADLFPNLRGFLDLCFSQPDIKTLSQCDLVFYATPNGTAMKQVPALLAAGVKVVDLAADFRLSDPALWEQWYGMPHTCPELLQQAVYGLPEIHRDNIKNAQLVANPGCYPTAVQLGFLPLLEAGLIDPGSLIADTKSGASGAGRGAAVGTLLAESADNFRAYKADGHRHLPEIRQRLEHISGKPVSLTFVPHLLPMIRGIHATLYARLNQVDADLQSLFEQRYANELFVDVLPAGSHPETRTVRGINTCRLAIHRPQGGDTVVILSVIDNLVKGAAGQAIQNMNLMLGLPEQQGLEAVALLP
ncbi:N-acetyl-gamma-glutamyl-phosphate reductase [Candidatus Venteria ishoeyi]|uniref:N-acetyl-gamma-glutamyl-phosphate reductase n=1 Tax=Candidatus Venteria ishoeyi TaxID=1899563 RepID=UPI0025A5D689|nr:N-acetyl-gamma-glutamyl-phosphate reductase [Candidatus Venteria ishoeyi]MDM8545097.1 N-acetyl-gamma-glutamyl-phosphate reductase [Candidatus Venteria ishoeyi]